MIYLLRTLSPIAGVLCLGLLALPLRAATPGTVPFLKNRFPPGILTEEDQSRAVLPANVELRRVSAAGVKLTTDWEGWSATRYDDAAGYCTIGYGHLIKKARCDGTESPEFLRGIDKPRGAVILRRDLSQAEITVMLEIKTPLNDNQYAAIVDFVFNVGAKNFRTSTLLQRLNDGRFQDVPLQLGRWTLANGMKFVGLVNRRKAEAALFVAGDATARPAPSQDNETSKIDIVRGERPLGK